MGFCFFILFWDADLSQLSLATTCYVWDMYLLSVSEQEHDSFDALVFVSVVLFALLRDRIAICGNWSSVKTVVHQHCGKLNALQVGAAM